MRYCAASEETTPAYLTPNVMRQFLRLRLMEIPGPTSAYSWLKPTVTEFRSSANRNEDDNRNPSVNVPSRRCQALLLVHPDPRIPTLVLYCASAIMKETIVT